MEDRVVCDSPLVRVNGAYGRLAPCDELPAFSFASEPAARGRKPADRSPEPGDPARDGLRET